MQKFNSGHPVTDKQGVKSWQELLALPGFSLPDSSRWWKIEPINDDGDMGLYALRVPLTDEWEFMAHVSEPEADRPVVAVNHPYGLKFIAQICLSDVKYSSKHEVHTEH